jgi:hypothetical protein
LQRDAVNAATENASKAPFPMHVDNALVRNARGKMSNRRVGAVVWDNAGRIKEIAAEAGISIGPVDCALHNRAGVNPKTRARVSCFCLIELRSILHSKLER